MATPTITRRDTLGGRWYEVDDHRLPSVTYILQAISKPALISWAASEERKLVTETAADLYEDVHGTPKMSRPTYIATLQGRLGKVRAHQKELAKAAEIGSQIHSMIEWNLRRMLGQKVGPQPRLDEKAQWGFMAWEDWARSVRFKPILIEQQVFSLMHGYAGTLDVLGEIDGVLTIGDWKTGKAVYPEALLQSVAYQVALAEMGHHRAEAGIVIRLPKVETDPEFEVVPVPAVSELFPTFLAVKQVWQWQYESERVYQERRAAQTVSV